MVVRPDRSNKMQQATVVSILQYGCTTWTLTKRIEIKLDGNYTRMLWAILNKSWRQHLTKQQLYDYQPPITKSIQVRRTRHAEHCRRSKSELIDDILLLTILHGRANAGRPARTYIQKLCADTRYSLEDLQRTMDDRDGRSVLAAWHNDDQCINNLTKKTKCIKSLGLWHWKNSPNSI